MNNIRHIPCYIGTMGFSYKDWNGAFYPTEMPAHNYLAYYSRIFKSVEIDSTFYGTPKPATVRRWSSMTPPDFKFSLKVPKSITHATGLIYAWGLMDEFLQTIDHLGERLGVILLQFPPSFKSNQSENLTNFISRLPEDFCYAIEVRNQSWYTAEAGFANILRSYKIAWAATQYPGLPEDIHPSVDFLYIRWIGQHGAFAHHNQERLDRSLDMQRWWQKILAMSDKVSKVFGYFNNDFAGFAAGSALKFFTLMGESVELPQQPKQAKLF